MKPWLKIETHDKRLWLLIKWKKIWFDRCLIWNFVSCWERLNRHQVWINEWRLSIKLTWRLQNFVKINYWRLVHSSITTCIFVRQVYEMYIRGCMRIYKNHSFQRCRVYDRILFPANVEMKICRTWLKQGRWAPYIFSTCIVTFHHECELSDLQLA